MSRRAPAQRGGRPFLGRTAQVWGRVTSSRREEIEALADEKDVAMAQVVASLLDVAFEHLDELELPAARADQHTLPLKAG